MKVLVIGGTGFMGPWVVRLLVEAGHDVAVFHRGETRAELPGPVHVIHGDRRRLSESRAHFEAFAPQVVVDMYALNERDARGAVATFRDLAERLVVVSSMDVYRAHGRFTRLEPGAPEPGELREDSPLRGTLFPYRAQAPSAEDRFHDYEKLLVERAVLCEERLAGTVLRLPVVFGPGDPRHRLAEYLKPMDAGEDLLVEASRARWRGTRDDVENVAAAIALAATHPGAARRVFNVSAFPALTEEEWIHALGEVVGWRGQLRSVSPQELTVQVALPYDWSQDLAANTRRIHRELGYQPRVSLPMALKRAVAWERTHGLT